MKFSNFMAAAVALATTATGSPVPLNTITPKTKTIRAEGDSGLSITLYEFEDCNSGFNPVVTATFDMTYGAHNVLTNPSYDMQYDDGWRTWGSFSVSRGLNDGELLSFVAFDFTSQDECTGREVDAFSNQAVDSAACYPLSPDLQVSPPLTPSCIILTG